MTFQALLAKPLHVAEVKRLVDTELARIVQFVSPVMVYLFGSAARGEMTTASDLDFLVVVSDDAPMRDLKKRYYASSGEREVPVDAIFVTESEFQKRAGLGGVCMVCRDEGLIVYQTGQGQG